MILLAIALQAAAPPAASGQQWSILNEDCARPRAGDDDIVVCAEGTASARLPLPDERVPTGPVPSNPDLTATGALAAHGTPCAATQRGCAVGFGPPIMPLVGALKGAVKNALARKPDKTGRVAIPLDQDTPLPGFEVAGD